MRKLIVMICLLAALSAAGCQPAVAPSPFPTATISGPIVGTAVPGNTGSFSAPPPLATTAAPEASSTPAPTAELIKTGTSGIHLVATIGPTCPGPERPGQVCTKPYQGEFVVTDSGGTEVAQATTNQDGQTLINLSPGTYTVTLKIEGRFPSGAPVNATVAAGQYAEVNIELDSGIR